MEILLKEEKLERCSFLAGQNASMDLVHCADGQTTSISWCPLKLVAQKHKWAVVYFSLWDWGMFLKREMGECSKSSEECLMLLLLGCSQSEKWGNASRTPKSTWSCCCKGVPKARNGGIHKPLLFFWGDSVSQTSAQFESAVKVLTF